MDAAYLDNPRLCCRDCSAQAPGAMCAAVSEAGCGGVCRPLAAFPRLQAQCDRGPPPGDPDLRPWGEGSGEGGEGGAGGSVGGGSGGLLVEDGEEAVQAGAVEAGAGAERRGRRGLLSAEEEEGREGGRSEQRGGSAWGGAGGEENSSGGWGDLPSY